MDRDDAVNMLAYFWQEKGDLERWCGFDREQLASEFPAVLKAWDDYKTSRLVLSAVVRDLKANLDPTQHMSKDDRSATLVPAVGAQVERGVRRVRINVGALVSQDHGVGRWPATQAGDDVDADMVFDADWNGRWWDCRADGFGRLVSRGESGGYGNGSIFVHDREGVTLLDDAPNVEVTDRSA